MTSGDEQHWIDTATRLAGRFGETAAELDDTATLPVGNLAALHASGLDQATLPVEYGGRGMSFSTFGEVVRIVSKGCPSTACIWLMHIGAAVGLMAGFLGVATLAGALIGSVRARARLRPRSGY